MCVPYPLAQPLLSTSVTWRHHDVISAKAQGGNMGTFSILFRMVLRSTPPIFSFVLIFSKLDQQMSQYYWTKVCVITNNFTGLMVKGNLNVVFEYSNCKKATMQCHIAFSLSVVFTQVPKSRTMLHWWTAHRRPTVSRSGAGRRSGQVGLLVKHASSRYSV